MYPRGENHGLFLYDNLIWIYFVVISQEKSHSRKRMAFFSEICPSGKWNSFAVKYLLRKCEIFADANVGKFHFTSTKAVGGGRYFTISARKLFHIRRKPNISLKTYRNKFRMIYKATPWFIFESVVYSNRQTRICREDSNSELLVNVDRPWN